MQDLLNLLKRKERMVQNFKRKITGYQSKATEVDSLRKRIDQHEDLINDVFDLNQQPANDFELLDGIDD